jgi:hypothetical protein
VIRLYKDFDNRVILRGGGGWGEQNVRKEGKGFVGVGGGESPDGTSALSERLSS